VRRKFLDLLACPECGSDVDVAEARVEEEGGDLVEGELACSGCGRRYPVRGRVPVFVDESQYADSFGWQWLRWAKLQRDSYNGTNIVRNTILKRSGWSPEHLAGKRLVECGCGSGSETEVLAGLADTVVAFDLSEGVFAFDEELLRRENVLVMRADILHIPLKRERFDVVYCHRVIMHTPDPAASFASMAPLAAPGGEFFLHSYSTHWKSLANYKYLWRPLTKHLPHTAVYRILRVVGWPLYLLHGVLNRLAFLRRLNRVLIPFEYHSRNLYKAGTTLTFRERYEYSFLITFDALTPTFDNPSSAETLRGWFEDAGFDDVEVRFHNPVIVLGHRATDVELAPRAAEAAPAPGKPARS
jgi:2-polyprenyl-3-methyl-5-hydroxy-6-metoxy-1,4-benzoquinol methylase